MGEIIRKKIHHMQKPRQLEKIIKGVANHRRIEIATLLDKTPELALVAPRAEFFRY